MTARDDRIQAARDALRLVLRAGGDWGPRFLLREGTATEWTDKNPILLDGEPGFESDTIKLKIGDGVTDWINLPYLAGGGTAGPPGPPGADGGDGEDGQPGPPGAPGAAGSSGTGSKGATGATGDQGPRGEDGLDGDPGPPGAVGPAGATGGTGPAGPTGATGPRGQDGDDGTDGDRGPAGKDGVSGGTLPTGTGFRHMTGGAEDAAAKLVDTADINAEQVTYAKIQPATAASRLLLRGSAAGAGSWQEGTLGSGLSMAGTVLSGTGGSSTATTVEVNLAATATWQGKFTITDAGIGASSKVLCWQEAGPYTGKGTRADEAELQPVSVIAVEPAAGSAVVKWQTPPIVSYSHMAVGHNGTVTSIPKDLQAIATRAQRIGKVRGNVKFSYTVFA